MKRAAVGIVFLLAAILVVLAIRRSRAGWRVYLGLAGAALLYVPVLILLRLPEERLHLVQYGLFCGLVFAALRERRTHRPLLSDATTLQRIAGAPWLQSMVLTLAAGWIDEGIQGILPNRYYDLRDVALNLSAGILYLVGWRVVQATRSWESRSAVAPDHERRGNPGR